MKRHDIFFTTVSLILSHNTKENV